MNNNKNNSANTVEETNNKKVLYGGIGLLALVVFIGGLWYWNSGETKKKDSQTAKTAAEQVGQLIEHKFISPECFKATEELTKAKEALTKAENELGSKDTNENKKTVEDCKKKVEACKEKLKGFLKDQKVKAITESYTKKTEALAKCQKSLTSMHKALENEKTIDGLTTSLQELSKEVTDGSSNQEVKDNFKKASSALETAKAATDKEKRSEALKDANEKLYACVKNTGYCPCIFGEKRLIGTKDDLYKSSKKIRSEVRKISESENIVYSEEALKKELATWNKEYQTINDKNAVVVELKLKAEDDKKTENDK